MEPILNLFIIKINQLMNPYQSQIIVEKPFELLQTFSTQQIHATPLSNKHQAIVFIQSKMIGQLDKQIINTIKSNSQITASINLNNNNLIYEDVNKKQGIQYKTYKTIVKFNYENFSINTQHISQPLYHSIIQQDKNYEKQQEIIHNKQEKQQQTKNKIQLELQPKQIQQPQSINHKLSSTKNYYQQQYTTTLNQSKILPNEKINSQQTKTVNEQDQSVQILDQYPNQTQKQLLFQTFNPINKNQGKIRRKSSKLKILFQNALQKDKKLKAMNNNLSNTTQDKFVSSDRKIDIISFQQETVPIHQQSNIWKTPNKKQFEQKSQPRTNIKIFGQRKRLKIFSNNKLCLKQKFLQKETYFQIHYSKSLQKIIVPQLVLHAWQKII